MSEQSGEPEANSGGDARSEGSAEIAVLCDVDVRGVKRENRLREGGVKSSDSFSRMKNRTTVPRRR